MLAINALSMKERNKRLLTKLILKHKYSRAELAKHSSLTKAGVSVIIDDLIANKVISEYKIKKTHIGRPPTRLVVNADFMYAIGIDITRSNTSIGLVDILGNVLTKEYLPTTEPKSTLDKISEIVKKIIKDSKVEPCRISGIGITAPGPIDTYNGTILTPPGFDMWHNIDIVPFFKNQFNIPCYLENISSGLALCEQYWGTTKNKPDYLLLTVNDGIGSGIILEEKLSKKTSEIGHTSISYNGLKCKCGNIGCVECYASIPAILKNTSYSSWKEVMDNNDEHLIKEEAKYLSCALTNAVNTLGITDIILDGEISYHPQALISEIEENLHHNTITKNPPQISISSGFDPVTCAAINVFNAYFSFS